MSREPSRLLPTPTQTVGPFFHFGLADNPALGSIAPEGTPGEPLTLHVRVLDGEGVGVPDALVELYHADAEGRYATAPGPGGFTGFGRLPTGEDGACEFRTIRPGRVVDPEHGPQARHINVCLLARGLLSHLFTRIYFAGDDDLAADPLLQALPAERRATLLAHPDPDAPGAWRFDIVMQGASETVFLLR